MTECDTPAAVGRGDDTRIKKKKPSRSARKRRRKLAAKKLREKHSSVLSPPKLDTPNRQESESPDKKHTSKKKTCSWRFTDDPRVLEKVTPSIEFVHPRKNETKNHSNPYHFVKSQRNVTQESSNSSNTGKSQITTESEDVLLRESIEDIFSTVDKKKKDIIPAHKNKDDETRKKILERGNNEKEKGKKNRSDERNSNCVDKTNKENVKQRKSMECGASHEGVLIDTTDDPNSKEICRSKSEINVQTKINTIQRKEETRSTKRRQSEDFSEQERMMNQQLSGTTVEDAVKDMFGRRPRSNSTDVELNLPRRGLCDEDMVLESHEWDLERLSYIVNKKTVPPHGFHNLGNTCFLNATVQCLAYLPTFCQCMISLPDCRRNILCVGNEKSRNGHQKIKTPIRTLLQQIHGLGNGNNNGPIAPKGLVRLVSSLGGSGRGYKFRPGRQEDAHEFLIHLLDSLHDSELQSAGINQRKSGWRDRLPIPRLDETTLVHRMFAGYLRSQINCTSCGYKSNTYDPFLDLSLELKKSSNNLFDAFKDFTRKERLDNENKYKCLGCKKRVCATKQFTIFRPPLSLVIHLKRFTFGNDGWGSRYQGSKIHKPIEFPAVLKVPLSDGRKCEYNLTGLVIHEGSSATSGHYTAYIKRAGKNGNYNWFHMDDSYVSAVSEENVLKQKNAYVLFYCRKEVKLKLPSPPSWSKSVDIPRRISKTMVETGAINTTRIDGISIQKDCTKYSTEEFKDQAIRNQRVSSLKTKNEKNLSGKECCVPLVSPDRDENFSKPAETTQSCTEENQQSLLKPSNSKLCDHSSSNKGSTFAEKSNKSLPNNEISEKNNKKKEVTLNLGHRRGNVKVILGKSKKKKAWKPIVIPQKHEVSNENDLLGNLSVARWTQDSVETVERKQEKSYRGKALEQITSKERLRRKRMHTSAWDSNLDQGKVKKVKTKEFEKSHVEPRRNPFQHIQSSMQQINARRVKGTLKRSKINYS